MEPGSRIGPYEVLGPAISIDPEYEHVVARRADTGGLAPRVLIKVVPCLDPPWMQQWVGEARLAELVVHPHVARVIDVGHSAHNMYFVEEHVHGAFLRELMTSVPLEIALAIACAVCSGLHYVHELCSANGEPLNIVNRRMWPGSVLAGVDGIVRLYDVALPVPPHRGRPGLRPRVAYFSPEACRGRALDRRNDVYVLGAMLWEMTVGEPRFRGLTDFETIERIALHATPRPRARRLDYPAALEQIVMRALELEPSLRFATLDEMNIELEAFARSTRLATARDIAVFVKRGFPERAAAARRIG